MPAARCSVCGRNDPAGRVNYPCPVCGGEMSRMELDVPDADWEDQIHEALADLERLDESQRIVAWRLHELLEAGYELRDASVIAARFQGPDVIDLHRAVDLLQGGCPDHLAVQILL